MPDTSATSSTPPPSILDCYKECGGSGNAEEFLYDVAKTLTAPITIFPAAAVSAGLFVASIYIEMFKGLLAHNTFDSFKSVVAAGSNAVDDFFEPFKKKIKDNPTIFDNPFKSTERFLGTLINYANRDSNTELGKAVKLFLAEPAVKQLANNLNQQPNNTIPPPPYNPNATQNVSQGLPPPPPPYNPAVARNVNQGLPPPPLPYNPDAVQTVVDSNKKKKHQDIYF